MLNPLNIINKFIKSGNQKEIDRIKKIVKEINFLESDVSKSLEEVIEEHKVNPLWDTMNFEDLFSPEGQLRSMEEKGVASMQASIGLQLFLDEHCGGWQNTFG